MRSAFILAIRKHYRGAKVKRSAFSKAIREVKASHTIIVTILLFFSVSSSCIYLKNMGKCSFINILCVSYLSLFFLSPSLLFFLASFIPSFFPFYPFQISIEYLLCCRAQFSMNKPDRSLLLCSLS